MESFPILSNQKRYEGVDSIPWPMLQCCEKRVIANHDQSLNQLARRGGLSYSEAVAILNDRRWRSMSDLAAAQILRYKIDTFLDLARVAPTP